MADIAELLHQGIAAAKAGQDAQARDLLARVIEQDEDNEQAWLWLSSVVESLDDRRLCLEQVMAINPGNVHAQAGLRQMAGAVTLPLRGEAVASPLGEGEGSEQAVIPPSPRPSVASLRTEQQSPPWGEGEGVDDATAALVGTAQSYLAKMQNVPEAIEVLNRAIEAQPANGQAYLLLGDAYLQQDNVAQAARYYSHAGRHLAASSRLGREARLKLAALQESIHPTAIAPVVEYAGQVQAAGMRRGVGASYTYGYAERPGCVTLYAVMAALAGITALVLGVLAGLAGGSAVSFLRKIGVSLSPSVLDIWIWLTVGVGVGTATVSLAIAVGLWWMKNWARLGVVVTSVLGVLAILCPSVGFLVALSPFFSTSLLATLPTPVWVIPLVGVALMCGAAYWFAVHRELFE